MPADADRDVEILRTRPWNSVLYGIPGNVKQVPTMLTDEEGRMLRWLTEFYYSGAGAICELGTFVGGSTARLAFGLSRNAKAKGRIECFDRYECRENMKQQLLYRLGIPRFDGSDILPIATLLLADFAELVNFHKCDILDVKWTGGPVEILFVDIAKKVTVAEHLATTFYPSLIPGRSIVVQQDYFHFRNPWVVGQMEMLDGYFELISHTETNSAIFLCTKAIPPDAIGNPSWQESDLARKVDMIAAAMARFTYRRQREFLAQCMFALKANPNAASSWEIKPVKWTWEMLDACLAEAPSMRRRNSP